MAGLPHTNINEYKIHTHIHTHVSWLIHTLFRVNSWKWHFCMLLLLLLLLLSPPLQCVVYSFFLFERLLKWLSIIPNRPNWNQLSRCLTQTPNNGSLCVVCNTILISDWAAVELARQTKKLYHSGKTGEIYRTDVTGETERIGGKCQERGREIQRLRL